MSDYNVYSARNTHQKHGLFQGQGGGLPASNTFATITPPTPDKPFFTSRYVDTRVGVWKECLLDDYCQAMVYYMEGNYMHPLCARFGLIR